MKWIVIALVAALLLISFSETISAATLCHVESTDIDYLVGFAIISDFDTYSEMLESGDFDGAYEFLYENIDYGYATEFENGEDVYIVDSDDDATEVRRPSEADWSWWTYAHVVVCPNSMVPPTEKKFWDIGPYNVSFDMGTIGNYTVEANQSWLAEGKLNLHIISGDDTAIIFGYPDQMGNYESEDSQKNRLDEDFYEYGVKPDYFRRTIDGQDGLLGVVGDGSFFEALYSKEVNGYGNILIKIISTFPWDKGTEDLLKTIKMEYTPNFASNNGMQYTGHQAGLMEEWERTYGPSHHCCDYLIRSASQTKDGGYIIAGLTENATAGKNYGYNAVLIKAGSDGQEEWNKTFEGAVIYSILQANDGDYIIAGAKGIEGSIDDAMLLKVDSKGNIKWIKTYGGPSFDKALSLQETPDDGYVLGGYTYSFGPAYVNAWLIKTDSDGNEEWNRTYGVSGINEANYIMVTDDGGYILAGETPVEDHLNAWIIKTDSRGMETWNKTFKDLVEYSYSTANAVQRTDDGGYILAGYQVNSDDDFLLIKIDSDGREEWTKAYGDPKQDEEAFAVLQTSDGGYLIAGNKGISPDSDGWVVKVDSNGREEWNKTFGDREDAGISSIQETSDGGFILAGKKKHDAWLLKLKG